MSDKNIGSFTIYYIPSGDDCYISVDARKFVLPDNIHGSMLPRKFVEAKKVIDEYIETILKLNKVMGVYTQLEGFNKFGWPYVEITPANQYTESFLEIAKDAANDT